MTPLYHRLVKRLTLPEGKRELLHHLYGLVADLSNVHCFDCTGVAELGTYWAYCGRKVILLCRTDTTT